MDVLVTGNVLGSLHLKCVFRSSVKGILVQ
jgi:hypothetical protein